MTILAILQIFLVAHLIYMYYVIDHINDYLKDNNGIESWEKKYYFTSTRFLWTLWIIGCTKVVALLIMIWWLFNKDSKVTRDWLVIGHAINFFCTLGSAATAFIAVNLLKSYFFPRGLTAGGEAYNSWIGICNIVPTILNAYFWHVSTRFARQLKTQVSSTKDAKFNSQPRAPNTAI